MTGSKSDYLERAMLDLIFGSVPWVPPAILYIGLYTVVPTEISNGTEANYPRVAVPNDLTSWEVAITAAPTDPTTPTAKWNKIAIRFDKTITPTTLVGFSVWDSPLSGANRLYWGSLLFPKSIVPARRPVFTPGSLIITEG